jgi:hypothetical protein
MNTKQKAISKETFNKKTQWPNKEDLIDLSKKTNIPHQKINLWFARERYFKKLKHKNK